MQRSTDISARYSIAVSECGAAREEIFAFRYVAMQIFDPPLRPVSQQIFALRYENLFCPESVYIKT